jgi:hypothetical protein
VLSSHNPPDPRRVLHQFKPTVWNPFFCSYCSDPKPDHHKCGHVGVVIGCETCTATVFSAERAKHRRRQNLEAMLAHTLKVGASR